MLSDSASNGLHVDPSATAEDIAYYSPGGYHPVLIGDVFSGVSGAYRIMHKLGFGSYATVWLAQRTDDSQALVSLKITTAQGQGFPEADMLAFASGTHDKLSESSRILTLLDKFEHEGPNGTHLVLITDVVAPLLSLHISRRLPHWRKAAAYGLAQAVAQLHAAGVVHGDLHLGNVGAAMPQLAKQDARDVMQDLGPIVVVPVDNAQQTPALPSYLVAPCDLAACYDKMHGDEKPQTKLFDFGSAHKAGTLPTRFQCAPEACAPEVAFARVVEGVKNPAVEPPSDVWALGASIYELVAGSSFFHGVAIGGLPQCMAAMSGALPPAWQAWWESVPRPPPAPELWWTEHRAKLRVGCVDDEDAETLVDLLKRILVLDPGARPSAADIVRNKWFRDAP
ncbi:kinase-like protein [Schizophyllum fasciatum]